TPTDAITMLVVMSPNLKYDIIEIMEKIDKVEIQIVLIILFFRQNNNFASKIVGMNVVKKTAVLLSQHRTQEHKNTRT
ncbi:TPA: hypothetical protein ACLGU7_004905, partial [Salmonella enterica]